MSRAYARSATSANASKLLSRTPEACKENSRG